VGIDDMGSYGKYTGEWFNGRYHGHGEFNYIWQWDARYPPDFRAIQTCDRDNGMCLGERYVGDWRGGLRHGQGTLTYADGRPPLKGIWRNGTFITPTKPDVNSNQNSIALDNERKKLEEEKLQLAEERRKLEEEKQKIKKPSNPGNSQKSQPSIKELRCTQLGLIQGSEDYKKCIN